MSDTTNITNGGAAREGGSAASDAPRGTSTRVWREKGVVLHGQTIDYWHRPQLKAVVVRGVDDASWCSYAQIKAWSAHGWAVIDELPIGHMRVSLFRYTSPDDTVIEGTTWKQAMLADLDDLLSDGRRFFDSSHLEWSTDPADETVEHIVLSPIERGPLNVSRWAEREPS